MNWSHPLLIALVVAVPPTAASLMAYVLTRYNSRQIKSLKVDVDGRLGQLIEVTRQAAQSEGEAKGAKDEQGRQKTRDSEKRR